MAVPPSARLHRLGWGPPLFSAGVLLVLSVLVGAAIRAGLINRFVVPLPLQIAEAFGRVIVDEGILHRFLQTAFEG